LGPSILLRDEFAARFECHHPILMARDIPAHLVSGFYVLNKLIDMNSQLDVSKQPQATYNVSSMGGFKKKFDEFGTFRISAQVRNLLDF
jgi:hypothetical protein